MPKVCVHTLTCTPPVLVILKNCYTSSQLTVCTQYPGYPVCNGVLSILVLVLLPRPVEGVYMNVVHVYRCVHTHLYSTFMHYTCTVPPQRVYTTTINLLNLHCKRSHKHIQRIPYPYVRSFHHHCVCYINHISR